MINLTARFFLALAMAFAVALVALPASAEEKGAAVKPDGEKPPPIILHVQMGWFIMPVTTSSSKKRRTVPGTLFMKVAGADDITPVCVLEPRIRDATLQTLFRNPPVVVKGKLDLGDTNTRLRDAANAVLGKARVTDVWLVSGVVRSGKKALKALPFDEAMLCAAVREEENRRREKEKSAGQ